MSLFASLGQGDIWALSGISFASPINDLLDKGSYTLEDLLNEDELIQEVKAKNDRLLEFLCTEKSINDLLDYVIVPAKATDSDLRKFKYPYMSCEVICCEVPELLHNLVEADEGKLLNKLFSFLDQKENLDCYLAGYFEKILEMLFRKLTSQMMQYFNARGIALLKAFLNHVQNYSIMQIIQRLMLPHLPFAAPSDNPEEGNNMMIDDNNSQTQTDFDHCNWSFLHETCELLLHKMFYADQADVPLHISDMLITVLQLSPPETLLVKYLCQPETVKTLLVAATAEDASDNDPSLSEQFSLSANISLAATSVLESLISRLYESGFPLHNATESDISRTEQETFMVVNEHLNQICEELAPLIPRVTTSLVKILENFEKTRLKFPTKLFKPRLGHHGLQLIKLIESLTRVGNPSLDTSFCENGLFEACLEVFLAFEYNSIMHLSVQRIFVTVLEGPTSRSATQAYVCNECDLLRLVMGRINSENYHQSLVNQTNDEKSEEAPFLFTERHSSIMGNIILIAHAAFLLLDCSEDGLVEGNNNPNNTSNNGDNEKGVMPQATSSSDNHWDSSDQKLQLTPETTTTTTATSNPNPASNKLVSRSLSSLGDRTELDQREKALLVREQIKDSHLLKEWDDFSATKLREVLDHQTMGSYEMPPAELMTASQDDPLKLGVDLDVFEDDDDDHPFDHYSSGGGGSSHHNSHFAHFPHMTKQQEIHGDPEAKNTVFAWSTSDRQDDFADFADFASFEDQNSGELNDSTDDPFADVPNSKDSDKDDPFSDLLEDNSHNTSNGNIDFGKTMRFDDF